MDRGRYGFVRSEFNAAKSESDVSIPHVMERACRVGKNVRRSSYFAGSNRT